MAGNYFFTHDMISKITSFIIHENTVVFLAPKGEYIFNQ